MSIYPYNGKPQPRIRSINGYEFEVTSMTTDASGIRTTETAPVRVATYPRTIVRPLTLSERVRMAVQRITGRLLP